MTDTDTLELRGNNGSIRLEQTSIVLTNALVGGERRLPYSAIRSVPRAKQIQLELERRAAAARA